MARSRAPRSEVAFASSAHRRARLCRNARLYTHHTTALITTLEFHASSGSAKYRPVVVQGMPEPELPPGWWVKNSSGSYSGPPLPELEVNGQDEQHIEDENETNVEIGIDIRPDSPGWEDVEPDGEALEVQCLLCSEQFPSASATLDHCKATHGFDFLATVKQRGLDFYATIKYINLIRLNVREGVSTPAQLSDPSLLASDELLKPTMENDALLFTLDEGMDFEDDAEVDGEDSMLVEGYHAG